MVEDANVTLRRVAIQERRLAVDTELRVLREQGASGRLIDEVLESEPVRWALADPLRLGAIVGVVVLLGPVRLVGMLARGVALGQTLLAAQAILLNLKRKRRPLAAPRPL